MRKGIWSRRLVIVSLTLFIALTLGSAEGEASLSTLKTEIVSPDENTPWLSAIVVVRAASGASYIEDRDDIAAMPALTTIEEMQAHITKYEPDPKDMQKVRAYLEEQGFNIVAQDNLFLIISGSRSDFESIVPDSIANLGLTEHTHTQIVHSEDIVEQTSSVMKTLDGLIIYPTMTSRPGNMNEDHQRTTGLLSSVKLFKRYTGNRCPADSKTIGEIAGLLDVDQLHAEGIYGTDVTIGFIDSGVFTGHRYFYGGGVNFHSFRFIEGVPTVVGNNFIDGETSGHGTMVASYLWAFAPNARLYSFAVPVNLTAQGLPDNFNSIAAYFAYINQDQFPNSRMVDIVSISIGCPEELSCDDHRPEIRTEMVNFMADGGIVLVAAGNTNQEVEIDDQKTSSSGHNGLAAIPEVIAVGGADYGTGDRDYRAAGNYNDPCFNKPGDPITGGASFDSVNYSGRHVPDLVGVFGPDICYPSPSYKHYRGWPIANRCIYKDEKDLDAFYQYASATSGATPQIAGMVALLKERFPTLNQVQVRSILEQAALDITEGESGDGDQAAEGYDLATGYGIPIATRVLNQRRTLYTGWNLIGLVKNHGGDYTALDLLNEINNQNGYVCDNVTHWNLSRNIYQGIQLDEEGEIYGFDFDLEPGIAYFVRCIARAHWVESGDWLNEAQTVRIQQGFNFLSFPYTDTPCTAGDVLEFTGCKRIVKYDGQVQNSGSAFSDIRGVNYPLASGQGYVLTCDGEAEWTPNNCDANNNTSANRLVGPGNYYVSNPRATVHLAKLTARAQSSIMLLGGGSPCFPRNIRVSNVGGRVFSVSWTTGVPCMGSVIINTGGDPTFRAYDDRGLRFSGTTHHVTVRGLTPETTYAFGLLSGDVWSDNGGEFYQVRTGGVLGIPSGDYDIHGQLVGQDRAAVHDAIIYAQLENTDVTPDVQSTMLSFPWNEDVSQYIVALDNARSDDADAYFDYRSATHVQIEAEGGSTGQDSDRYAIDLGIAPSITATTLSLNGATLSKPSLTAPSTRTLYLRPTFRFVATDSQESDLIYRLELSTDGFATVDRVYDQRYDTEGWSASSYASGQEAKFTLPDILENLRAYQWRVYAYNGEAWSSASDMGTFAITRYFDLYLPLVLRDATGTETPGPTPTLVPSATPTRNATATPLVPTPVYPTATPLPPAFWDVGLYNPDGLGKFYIQYGNGSGSFSGKTSWQWGNYPNDNVFTGDFDGDELWDVGLYNPNGNGNFYIQYGNGAGSFGGQTTWHWGNFPNAKVFTGDFDGDELWDVGLYNPNNLGNFYIQYGDGSGSFGDETAWHWGVFPSAQIFTGDFDGDELWDVGLYNPNSLGNFYIQYGRGSGSFGDQTAWNWEVHSRGQVFTGDFNGDGLWDVGFYNPNAIGNFYIKYGDGAGSFGGQTSWRWGSYSNAHVFTGDFNGE